MKYPKKYKKVKTFIKFPVLFKDGNWYCCFLYKSGEIEKKCIGKYSLKSHCWIPCTAHNKRVGYEKKEVKKIIKKYYKKNKS